MHVATPSRDADRPDWSVEGRDWPNRQHSRFVSSGGIGWHFQQMGEGPKLLMLHGTGAATHSFRDLAPLLAKHFLTLAPDLPGHGFTGMPAGSGLSLQGMARLTNVLLKQVGFHPDIVIGHSAGAAILIEMALADMIQPRIIIAINGALLPIRGASVFSPLAKLLFLIPFALRLFAWRALGQDATRRLLEGTGSKLEPRGVELYQRLFRKTGHIAGTLGMMANWDLDSLQRRIVGLRAPLVLITGANDRAVPPPDAVRVAACVKSSSVLPLSYGGHLVHEEQPVRIAALIAGLVTKNGVLPAVEIENLSNQID